MSQIIGGSKIIGSSPNGVSVYSNRNASRKNKQHYINGIYYGVVWQCVEFARRYWIHTFGLTFPSITNAYELMNLTSCISVDTRKKHKIILCKQGGYYPPLVHALIIWGKTTKYKTGHVAVITKITPNTIYITQQNKSKVHRILPYRYDNGFIIEDTYLLGWIYPKILS